MSKPGAHELATVINNFLPSLNAGNKLPAHKLRVLDALQNCRTEYMGGHIEACEDCGDGARFCSKRECSSIGVKLGLWCIYEELPLFGGICFEGESNEGEGVEIQGFTMKDSLIQIAEYLRQQHYRPDITRGSGGFSLAGPGSHNLAPRRLLHYVNL